MSAISELGKLKSAKADGKKQNKAAYLFLAPWFVGLVLMVLVGWVVYGQGSKVPPTNTMHGVGYYWHFVDVVWILLYIIVYVMTWATVGR